MPDDNTNKTVLTLTLPALQRLIGGDSEAEIQIRQGIVESFARRQLKCLLNDDVIRQVLTSARQEAIAIIAKQAQEKFADIAVTNQGWGNQVTKVTLKPEIVAEINKAVLRKWHEIREEAVAKAVEDIISVRQELIESVIEKKVNHRIDDLVAEGVRKRFEALAKG
jgi:hypothetical protein